MSYRILPYYMSKSTINRGTESTGFDLMEFLREKRKQIAFAIGLLVMFLWPITMGIPTAAL